MPAARKDSLRQPLWKSWVAFQQFLVREQCPVMHFLLYLRREDVVKYSSLVTLDLGDPRSRWPLPDQLAQALSKGQGRAG